LVPITYAQYFARLISRFLFKKSDHVVVVTKFLNKYVISEGVLPEKVSILLNGISLENTLVNPKKLNFLRSKLAIKEDDFILLYMGHLYDFAGLKEIVEYYHSDVISGKLNIKFLILGDGGIYKDLLNYTKEIGAEWVIMTGKVPFFDITEYIELADLCLMSFSLNNVTKDITPVKIMEYMAMKKPVLSNSLPNVVKEIGENNGVIFARNQNELIKNIRELVGRKETLSKIGFQGFDLIKKHYVWPTILNKLKEIIITLIKEKKYKK
jgi:glycosyltransferase involved in cell wall biosynthesis